MTFCFAIPADRSQSVLTIHIAFNTQLGVEILHDIFSPVVTKYLGLKAA